MKLPVALPMLLTLATAAGSPAAHAQAEAQPPVRDEGILGPVHRAHAGKVVFSRRPIPRAPQSAAAFAQQFALGDPIYLRPLAATSMENALRRQGVRCYKERRRLLMVQIGDAPRKEWVWLESKPTHQSNFDEWTTWSPDSDGKRPINAGPVYWPEDRRSVKFRFGADLLPALAPGTHRLTFHVEGECYGRGPNGYKMVRAEVARGTISLTVTAKSLKQHWRRKGPFVKRSPNPGNGALRRQMMRTVSRSWRNEKVLGAVTLSKGWNIVRHRFHGRPIRRWVEAGVVVRREGASQCRIFSLSFSQRSMDGRYRYDDRMELAVGDSVKFPCVNAP